MVDSTVDICSPVLRPPLLSPGSPLLILLLLFPCRCGVVFLWLLSRLFLCLSVVCDGSQCECLWFISLGICWPSSIYRLMFIIKLELRWPWFAQIFFLILSFSPPMTVVTCILAFLMFHRSLSSVVNVILIFFLSDLSLHTYYLSIFKLTCFFCYLVYAFVILSLVSF